jgi:phosphate transport system substrate-binding protein
MNGLPTASIVTSAGSEPVTLSVESVGKSIAAVTTTPRGNNMVIDPASLYAPTQPGAYPIVMTTYATVCSAYPDPQTSAAVKNFLTIALAEGQQDLADSGYVPTPHSLKDRLSTAINAIS